MAGLGLAYPVSPGEAFGDFNYVSHFARTGNGSVVLQITGYGPTGTKYTEAQ